MYSAAEVRRLFLSTIPASRRDWLPAIAAALLSLAVFASIAPFAKVQLPIIPAFVPAYESALLLGDLITAILLFGQFGILRNPAFLVLAGGYLFSGLMAVPHALTFPGVFAPTGLLGAGPQTTAWLYISWHIVFPLIVIVYALVKGSSDVSRQILNPGMAVGVTTLTAICAVALITLVTTLAEPMLPPILDGIHYTPQALFFLLFCGATTLACLVVLWLRRPHTLLDMWLMVVICAWLFDVGLSAALNNGRYDLGFYAGRIYVLLGASFVLGAMLVETTQLYARLAKTAQRATDQAVALDAEVRARALELQRSNETLRDREAQLTAAQRIARTGSAWWDMQTGAIDWSDELYRIYGVSKDSFTPTPASIGSMIHPDDRNRLSSDRDRFARGESLEPWEYRIVRPDGTVRRLYRECGPVLDEAGSLQTLIMSVQDITERRQIEDQLRQAQKMEAIGNLTGGMAHDFNNLLAVVIGNLDFVRELENVDAEMSEMLQEALDAALRGAELTRRLLAFARQQPLQPRRIEINDLVTNITRLLTRTLGEDIEIMLDLAQETWSAIADPAQLESSILNLANNSRDAMPSGGRLTIRTANRRLDEDYADLHAEVVAGDYVMIEVSDSGTGMPPEVISRIFEPFFTTKEQGRGTGLGLAMVFGFMKQSGGHVNVYSEPGVGTTFRLYLPRQTHSVDTSHADAVLKRTRGGTERILVVEDNSALRRVAVRQLTERGYRVAEAENAATALDCLGREDIALVLTDIVMPGGSDGIDMARRAHELKPGLKVIFTSGFPQSQISGAAWQLPENAQLLTKPYRREELMSAVRAALDA
jgi:PAS domain S-box-containing protein